MVDWSQVQYFTRDEFGTGELGQEPCPDLVKLLDKARHIAEVPFIIQSGLRSIEHNAAVGGRPGSAHIGGYAADIRALDSRTRLAVLQGLILAGAHRIGIGKTFVHVDVDPSKAAKVCWLY